MAPGYSVLHGWQPSDAKDQHDLRMDECGESPVPVTGVAVDVGYSERFHHSRQMAFVRKIYSILSLQLILTAGVAALFILQQDLKNYVQGHLWVYIVAYSLALVTLIPMVCCFRARAPINAILLALFTLCMSVMVGVVCTYYSGETVLKAVFITMTIFLGLTLYTIVSKHDFNFLGAGLFAALLCFILVGFIQIFFPFGTVLRAVWCVLGVLLFSLFIIYDTNKIWKRYQMAGGSWDDEWVVACIDLYLDIINLFILILQLLGGDRDR
eukprot:TRINITY_DN10038_c0_g1_i1.p1 TRINITY_DN10038_c0_g1~~TRINITY_DN10038_c0_g1_i1.p1  ORF type:complete len:291 (+),score=99.85 TRINITY_DN10038_c0_g1_i1:72-875(+)